MGGSGFSHTLACVFLTAAHSIAQLGVYDALAEVDSRKTLPTSDISRLCAVVIYSQMDSVLQRVQGLIEKYQLPASLNRLIEHHTDVDCSYDILSGSFSGCGGHRSGMMMDGEWCEPCSKFSAVVSGLHGRMLCATRQGVGRGAVVLQDTAYCSATAIRVASGNCYCACQEGPLLSLHLAMALAIDRSRNRNIDKYNRMMRDLSHGLHRTGRPCNSSGAGSLFRFRDHQGTTLNEGDVLPADGVPWSLQAVVLMALCCAVMTLYSITEGVDPELLDYPTASKVSSTASTEAAYGYVRKERLVEETWRLLQLLARLPQNTHAVTQLLPTAINRGKRRSSSFRSVLTIDEEWEMEEIRIGYALFLRGSAVNHCCSPNASVRFQISSPVDGALEKNCRYWLQILRKTCLEIVATASVSRGCEISISYGPLAGKHPVVLRRDVLLKQYLFHCWCRSCRTDLAKISTTANIHRQVECKDTGKKMQDITGLSAMSRRTEQVQLLCMQLDNLRDEVEAMNSLLSEVVQCVRDGEILQREQNSTSVASFAERGVLVRLQSRRADTVARIHAFTHAASAARCDESLVSLFGKSVIKPLGEKLRDLGKRHFPLEEELQLFIVNPKKMQYFATNAQTMKSSPYADDYLFIEYCGYLCNFLDAQGRILAVQGDFAAAAESIDRAVCLMIGSGMYSAEDVVVGRERVKQTQLLFSAQNFAAAASCAAEALRLMEPLVNQQDPDLLEVRNISSYLSARGMK